MDYRELLKRYINHVAECEGVTFLADIHRRISDVEFTDEEWSELEKIEDEAVDELPEHLR